MIDLNINAVIPTPVAANDDSDLDRVVALMTGMQEGINHLTGILVDHRARLDAMEQELRRIKARTDAAPKPKPSIILPRTMQ